jgi:hypothetical protein
VTPPAADGDGAESGVVLGLGRELDEPVSAVLARIPWNGPVLDPDQLSAAEFMSALP